MRSEGLTLVLGGVSSGKSRFAEDLVSASGGAKVYIATAEALDAEMQAKIARHQARRGDDWQIVEAPRNLPAVLAKLTGNQVVLLDCASMWLTNILMDDGDIRPETKALLQALRNCPAQVVVVSNEVGLGGVADNPLLRKFQRHQGELNQELAQIADLVVFVTAGLPITLKGVLPGGAA